MKGCLRPLQRIVGLYRDSNLRRNEMKGDSASRHTLQREPTLDSTGTRRIIIYYVSSPCASCWSEISLQARHSDIISNCEVSKSFSKYLLGISIE